MKFCTSVTLVLLTIALGYGYKKFLDISGPLPLPELDTDAFWGPGSKSVYTPSEQVVPFTVQYAQAPGNPIAQLKKSLNKTLLLHPPLEGVGFEYGVNSRGLNTIVKDWRDEYLPRWEERESFLNQFPQFTTEIQGLKIHFIHVKPIAKESAGKTVVPLLLIHGWPGSVREFYEIIPKLTKANKNHNLVFEVIAPSLPGYGFSQASSKTGFGSAEMAIVLRNLMLRLGHQRFFIQGGDWGSILGSNIATIFPDNVLGYHSNMCYANSPLSHFKTIIASYYPTAFVDAKYVDYHFPKSTRLIYTIVETGYFHIQATKPDTIGTALSNNPIGLLAYIFEKFSTWTNVNYREHTDGGWAHLDKSYRDAILDNIMIYYLTNSITTSQRLYSEQFTFKQVALKLDRVPTNVPVACARFRHDIMHALDWELRPKYPNLVQSTYYSIGGHFAAMEQAQLLFDDFSQFVKIAYKK